MESCVTNKCCPVCGKHVVGRTDKKFCSDKCRSKFHYGNSRNKESNSILKQIKRVLKKDGTLILAMDSGSWLFRLTWFVWEKTKGKIWRGAHLYPFHHQELEQLIIKSNFKIKQKIFSFFGMEVTFVLNKI